MKFVFMANHRRSWPVAWLCNAFGQRLTFASKQTGRFWQRLRLVRFKALVRDLARLEGRTCEAGLAPAQP
jgi:hypothetical protein